MSNKPDRPSRAAIDENLRRIYNETLSEDVPDRFKDLLAKLRDLPTTTHGDGDPK